MNTNLIKYLSVGFAIMALLVTAIFFTNTKVVATSDTITESINNRMQQLEEASEPTINSLEKTSQEEAVEADASNLDEGL